MTTLSPSSPAILDAAPVMRKPTRRNRGDRIFFQGITVAVLFVPLLVMLFLGVLIAGAWPAVKAFGWKFFITSQWDANAEGGEAYGALPFIWGTLVTAFFALLLAAPIGIGVAAFLSEIVRGKLRSVIAFLLEILATIPSVVYGMWGLFVLAPFIAEHAQPRMKIWQTHLDQWFGKGNVPIFQFRGFPNGLGLGTAILVMAVMILPLIVSISLDAMRAVPTSYREAALGLGATRWEMIRIAVLPPARSGIFGGCILALGRALGETMAVTMVIGNNSSIKWSFLAQANTISSIIANEYGEADGLKLAALMELALILFVMTLVVNLIARYLTGKLGVSTVVK
jgi:phosphate transport system permease protein